MHAPHPSASSRARSGTAISRSNGYWSRAEDQFARPKVILDSRRLHLSARESTRAFSTSVWLVISDGLSDPRLALIIYLYGMLSRPPSLRDCPAVPEQSACGRRSETPSSQVDRLF